VAIAFLKINTPPFNPPQIKGGGTGVVYEAEDT
jgi:hypothetical protein